MPRSAATASTTSASSASRSRSSSCWPSQSTRKFPVTPLSAWMVMPGRISSPSSKPSRSRSKCASPIPYALCVGFSRSWALIAIWKAWRFLAIFDVSDIGRSEATGAAALHASDEVRGAGRREAVAPGGAQDGAADRVELVVGAAGGEVGAQRRGRRVGEAAQLGDDGRAVEGGALGAGDGHDLGGDRLGVGADLAQRRVGGRGGQGQPGQAGELAPQDRGVIGAVVHLDPGAPQRLGEQRDA